MEVGSDEQVRYCHRKLGFLSYWQQCAVATTLEKGSLLGKTDKIPLFLLYKELLITVYSLLMKKAFVRYHQKESLSSTKA